MSNQINDKLDKILKLNEALQRQAKDASACIAQLSAKVKSLQANIDMMKSGDICGSSETLKVPRVLSVCVYITIVVCMHTGLDYQVLHKCYTDPSPCALPLIIANNIHA